ncbi:hypothetical protein DRP04_02830 [Archaeoglobales archaeon]|nr:MAG: hypothetical protein DRP04_02830 [Archaeoglobales archaeon]
MSFMKPLEDLEEGIETYTAKSCIFHGGHGMLASRTGDKIVLKCPQAKDERIEIRDGKVEVKPAGLLSPEIVDKYLRNLKVIDMKAIREFISDCFSRLVVPARIIKIENEDSCISIIYTFPCEIDAYRYRLSLDLTWTSKRVYISYGSRKSPLDSDMAKVVIYEAVNLSVASDYEHFKERVEPSLKVLKSLVDSLALKPSEIKPFAYYYDEFELKFKDFVVKIQTTSKGIKSIRIDAKNLDASAVARMLNEVIA